MINKLYSALTAGYSVDGAYYGRHQSAVTVPGDMLDLVSFLIPRGSVEATAFRASSIIAMAQNDPSLWPLIKQEDPENTYKDLPPYRHTAVIMQDSHEPPSVLKKADCTEPSVLCSATGYSSDCLVVTNTGSSVRTPWEGAFAKVVIPNAYTVFVPKAWGSSGTSSVTFQITGTPVQPVFSSTELKAKSSQVDKDILELMGSTTCSMLAALCAHLVRRIYG